MKYRNTGAPHIISGLIYPRDAVVETDEDLAAKYPTKFVRVTEAATVYTPVLLEGTAAAAKASKAVKPLPAGIGGEDVVPTPADPLLALGEDVTASFQDSDGYRIFRRGNKHAIVILGETQPFAKDLTRQKVLEVLLPEDTE